MQLTRREIERYIFTKLGHPIVAVELAPENVAMAISEAVQEYQSSSAAEKDYLELFPTDKGNEFILPPEVSAVTGVVYAMPFQAVFHGTNDIFSFNAPNMPYGSNYGATYNNMAHVSSNLAIFYQYLQDRLRVLGNDITWKTIKNKLYVYPYPKTADKIIVEYSRNVFTEGDDVVSVSNTWAQNWIRSYSLAVCKGMLAQIRGKFSSIAAGPDESQTLNASDLQQQSLDEIQRLREQLDQRRSDTQFFIY